MTKATNLGGWFRVSVDVKKVEYASQLQKQLTAAQQAHNNIFTEFCAGSKDTPFPEEFLTELSNFVGQGVPTELLKVSVLFILLGGKTASRPPGRNDSIPESTRNARYFVSANVVVKPANVSTGGIAVGKNWIGHVMALFAPHVKRLERVNDENRLQEQGLSNELASKLKDIKTKYDPNNLFKQNFNISPKAV